MQEKSSSDYPIWFWKNNTWNCLNIHACKLNIFVRKPDNIFETTNVFTCTQVVYKLLLQHNHQSCHNKVYPIQSRKISQVYQRWFLYHLKLRQQNTCFSKSRTVYILKILIKFNNLIIKLVYCIANTFICVWCFKCTVSPLLQYTNFYGWNKNPCHCQ